MLINGKVIARVCWSKVRLPIANATAAGPKNTALLFVTTSWTFVFENSSRRVEGRVIMDECQDP